MRRIIACTCQTYWGVEISDFGGWSGPSIVRCGLMALLKLVHAELCCILPAVSGDVDLIGPVLQKKLQARLKAHQLSSAQK